MAHLYLALVYEENRMYSESVAEALNARKLSGQFEDSVPRLRDSYAHGGWNAFLRQYLAVMLEHSTREYVPPYWIAVLYLRLGDSDTALEWLGRSIAERDDGPPGPQSGSHLRFRQIRPPVPGSDPPGWA
jgi:hypothetical protein